jgi:energy-coupling factor transport system ATP-binding protein
MMATVVEFNAKCRTVVLITHDMSLVAEYASRVIVLGQGRVLFEGTTLAFFSRREVLAQAGLAAPAVKLLARRLSRYGFNQKVLTPADFVAEWQMFLAGAPSRERPERSPGLGESASPRVAKPE